MLKSICTMNNAHTVNIEHCCSQNHKLSSQNSSICLESAPSFLKSEFRNSIFFWSHLDQVHGTRHFFQRIQRDLPKLCRRIILIRKRRHKFCLSCHLHSLQFAKALIFIKNSQTNILILFQCGKLFRHLRKTSRMHRDDTYTR